MLISLPSVAFGSILKMRGHQITIICIEIGDKLHVAHAVYPALNMQEFVIVVVQLVLCRH